MKSIFQQSDFIRRKAIVELRKFEAVIKNDPADRLAAELQDVLLQGWSKSQQDAINTVIKNLKGNTTFTQTELDEMVEALRPILGDLFAGNIAAAMEEIELKGYAVGLTGKAVLNAGFNVVDLKAIDWLKQHNIYWVKNFFDDQLQEKVVEFGTKIISEGLSREDAGLLFEDEFAKKYEAFSWRYWQGFANHVVTRSREFGAVERYVRSNTEWLQVKAVIDQRTTEICRHMHNRVISVSKAVEIRDALVASTSPEEVKKIAPWMKPEALAAKPSKSLPSSMALPPYHFNCRSRTVKASKTAIEQQVVYESNVQQLHKNGNYKKSYEEYRALGEEAPVNRSLRFDENVVKWMEDNKLAPSLEGKLNAYKKAFKELSEGAAKNAAK